VTAAGVAYDSRLGALVVTGATPTLRVGQPVWLRHADRTKRRYPILSGSLAADVAIVGGGMTGALVAHAFASAGISSVLLEGSLVGRGSTAASSALLLQEPDLELTQLIRRYGVRRAKRIWQLSHESVRQLVALLTQLRIGCDLRMCDAVYYTTAAESVERLQRECALRTRHGFPSKWLGPVALRRLTGISGHGAIRTRGSARFDPYRACVGMVRAAVRAGARVFERSRVHHIYTKGNQVRVHTRDGVINADRVVIATGYATPQFRPLTGRFRMYRTYVLGTAPLSIVQRNHLGLADVLVWDTERPYHYARWVPGHRLLLGGSDRLVRPRQKRAPLFAAATQELRAYFEAQLPILAELETPLAWEGLFAITSDSLPYIGPHRHYPRHWFALGYGGNGMTFGYLAARLLLERWQRAASDDHALFAFGRVRQRKAS
jgi:glycine/D-amino acid oxidase-like deaminating enzyme